MSEYNLRQISLMQTRINQYKEGEIRIDQLINDLQALLNCLEEIDENWKDSFLSAWSILEIVYAGALFDNKTNLDDNDMLEVNRGLNELEILINNLLMN